MVRAWLAGAVLAWAFLGAGCALVAPQYSASIDNVQKLKDAGDFAAKVGSFESVAGPGNPPAISLRGSSLASPYASSYASYLAEALKQELSLAGRYKPDAGVEVTGSLIKNDLDASGISLGSGTIEARFVVKAGNAVRYDQVKAARSEWESSFMGAVAIPRAQQEYPRLVQKLLGTLFADDAFLKALK